MGKGESYVEDYLVLQAKKNGIWCKKFSSPGTTGVPDRILIGHGMTCFVETKQMTGRLQSRQIIVCDDMRNHGAIVLTAYSRQDVDEIIKSIVDKTIDNKVKPKEINKNTTTCRNNIKIKQNDIVMIINYKKAPNSNLIGKVSNIEKDIVSVDCTNFIYSSNRKKHIMKCFHNNLDKDIEFKNYLISNIRCKSNDVISLKDLTPMQLFNILESQEKANKLASKFK